MNRRSFVEVAAAGLLSRFRVRANAPPGVIRAYTTQAQLEGAVVPDGPKVTTRWTGPGSATWKIEVASADEYEAALCYACAEPGAQLVLSGGTGTLETNTRMTMGFYADRSSNFERVPCRGSLHLPAGSTEFTLRLSKPQGKESMRLRSVELTPVSWKPRVEGEERRATKARASTDWLVRSGYGVMFHWTGQSKPRTGPPKTYAEAVRDFPIKDFVEMVQETGAGHVLFTVNHAIPHCPAPIASWEKVHPGMTTSRDLLGELADALAKADIRFLLYINSPTFGNMTRAGSVESSPGPSDAQYVDMHCEVLNEIGKRYGRKLHGYWFDSWYQSFERYPKVQQERIFEACKTGNQDRITAFNFWTLPVCTPWQEYWAGEVSEPGPPASSRYIERGAGAGLQFQSLLYLDAPWVHSRPDAEMEPPRFSDEVLASYVQSCMQNQGAVTVNLGVYQDASIGRQARQLMRSVRRKTRGS
jgi:hypothetical protein